MKKTKFSSGLSSSPYLVWMVIFIVLPLFVVLYYAFTDYNTGEFTLANIAELFNSNYLPVIIKSIWLALLAAVVCLIIGYPVAYCIAKASPTAQKILLMLIMLPMCMSFLLRTLAWVSLLRDTGIINSLLGVFGIEPLPLIRTSSAVVLGMVYNYLPYMILPLHSVMSKMDNRLVEAAQDLGCNGVQVFRRVTLPLSLPGIISGFTMVFVPAVSTFYISKKLGPTDMVLIGDVIEAQFKTAYNPNLGAAMSLLLMVIILVCVGVMNRVSGINEEDMVG